MIPRFINRCCYMVQATEESVLKYLGEFDDPAVAV